jgi:hypothetical protein
MSLKAIHYIFAPIAIFLVAVSVEAQGAGDAGSDSTLWIIIGGVVAAAGIGAVVFMRMKKSAPKAEDEKAQEKSKVGESQRPAREFRRDVIFDSKNEPLSNRDLLRKASTAGNFSKDYSKSVDISHLPIAQIETLSQPVPFDELETSDDDGLIAAIEELQDDAETDADFRMIALRVLASFRARNAVESLTQVALYDLSASLRSKAVSMLADFDHPSVFEPIVLACADPSREVRAASARALVKVTFDRADEWARFASYEDMYLSRQIAKAAVEAGIAERSFDRLILHDEKAAYEAFALVYMLIRTGETERVFDAIRNHRDGKTRMALLHAIKVANVAEVIPELSSFIADEPISSPVADKAREVLLGINSMPVGA